MKLYYNIFSTDITSHSLIITYFINQKIEVFVINVFTFDILYKRLDLNAITKELCVVENMKNKLRITFFEK